MPEVTIALLVLVIFLALAFDFINGFHDTANAIAASVSTGVLTPRRAILMAAILNFLGAITVGTAVAKTIGKGIIDPVYVTQPLIVAALLSAIFWNLVTWYWGLPSSSSHALIGGIVGAGIAGHGFGAIHWLGPKSFSNIVQSLVLSPVLGFAIAFTMVIGLYWICRRFLPHQVRDGFRVLQIFAAAFISFSHGSNDAQKAMGIITMALISAGMLSDFTVPTWVMVACAMAMGIGTASGGTKIIKTMGTKIVKLQPIQGFGADMTSAFVITLASHFGLPVSTTHVAAGSIMGVGSTRRFSAVRWGVAGNMVTAWIVTIPITATLAYIFYWFLMSVLHLH
ncbi:inorganic phosphate transporter [bacterium]|nr:inorganic phosphate transporter [bacterium]